MKQSLSDMMPVTRSLFIVGDHHVADSGIEQQIRGDRLGMHHGYFENIYSEEFVF
jgi:hypothetical protein